MGTRSNINVKVGDVYHTVYTHWDGYPEGVGETLLTNYNSQELAEQLVSHGDISSVGIYCDKPEGHTFDNPVADYTIYYGRDRGENGTEMQIRDNIRYEEEYSYVWNGNEWLMSGTVYIEESENEYEQTPLSIVLGIEESINGNDTYEDDLDKVFKYFGCSIEEVISINNEWLVQYNTDDPRMTDSYNERSRWSIRHREAPYQGMDEDGIWHHTFFGRTLYEAVTKANEYLKRGKEFESERKI